MTRARRERQARVMVLALPLALMLGGGAFLANATDGANAREPRIAISSSLPLRGTEGLSIAQVVQGQGDTAPVWAALAALGQLEPLDTGEQLGAMRPDLVLLVHPPAWSPADMVAFDAWVRSGGRAIVLADALSSWPTAFPLGDRRNPPITTVLTPLLDHWGLDLAAPLLDASAPETVLDGTRPMTLMSAGTWRTSTADCTATAAGRVVRCRIGKGRVTLVADADWLHPSLGGSPDTIPGTARDWLTAERDSLLR